ncbi:uncharacterized protein PHACADRAFT_252996 [Phanerochaete carnosa HHB-10118-sp]|uniref:Amidase domain-containing protein n=1 Tax=Phanerochaete carnosa (strain HHB-10118-sp) TaxID=650164 RepID=K5W3U6_PHACS|nr:uncharacterized protein PHACADRAFT_252996 [Phanerochaete carnosa HHB-10118-sp]EKM58558.1 hypothetical protein PHACADRAFT_252996 [Phanerochaete carnosa HHB-10118-sp]
MSSANNETSRGLHAPPVTKEVLQQTASLLGVQVPDRWEEDFTIMLGTTREAMEKILDMEDFVIQPDLKRFPRKDVSRPGLEENSFNAWATKAIVENANEDERSHGLLAGKKVVLKDNICLAGVPCEFGTKVFEDWIPRTDATVVTRTLEAGGTIIGKATCENFCSYGVSNTAATGPVGNVYDKTRSAGGSSSGCGVLVALGEADMGIGGDQGGSIRIPASHLGIVGLKPTFGLVPYTGIISSETAVDHTGPMSRDVMSNALLLQVLAGVDGLDDRQLAGTPLPDQVPNYTALLSSAKSARALLSVGERKSADSAPGATRPLRIGVLKEGENFGVMDPRVAACVRAAVEKFKELGAEVVDLSVPGHTNVPVFGRVQRIASNSLLGRHSGTRQMHLTDLNERLLPWTQGKFEKLWFIAAHYMVSGMYAEQNYPQLHGKVHNLIRKLKLDYDAVLEGVDLMVMPTLPWVAKKLMPPDASPLAQLKDYDGLTSNTMAFNLTGHPALSVPCGMLTPPEGPEDLRLPVGMQLIGKYHDELTLYKAALAWSDAFNWKEL